MDLSPDLVLLKVFSFLSVEEKFGTLRLVCKNWKQVIESIVPKELVVYDEDHPLKKRWPSDDSPVDLRNVVRKSFYDFHLTSGRHKTIKRLLFYRIDWNEFDRKGLLAKLLDCMCQLEELSIDQTQNEMYPDDLCQNAVNLDSLTLPYLRVLSVKQGFDTKVNITAPKLEKLVLWDLWFTINKDRVPGLIIALSHPEHLKSLECQQADLETRLFPNLEQLTALSVALNFDLSHFTKLKRLDLFLCFSIEGFHLKTENLLEQRRRLLMNDLEITNLGAKAGVDNHNYLLENVHSTSVRFPCGYDVYHFVNNFMVDYYVPWSLQLDWTACRYERLGALGRFQLNIECVSVWRSSSSELSSDPNPLIKFLVQIGGVKCLKITHCTYEQKFYEMLSTVPYIGHLSMIFEPNNPRFTPDFEFISRMRWLNAISLFVDRFMIDSFWAAFKKTKIKGLRIVIVQGNKHLWPILELRKNRNALRFKYFGTDDRDREFDCKDAAFSALKEEHEKLSE